LLRQKKVSKEKATLIREKLRCSARAEGMTVNAPWRVLVWAGANGMIASIDQIGIVIGCRYR
jgi:hypothetical protein